MYCRPILLAAVLLLSFAGADAQITMTIYPNSAASKNDNFRLAGTTRFSVAYSPDQYRLYATTHIPRLRWRSGSPITMRDLYFETFNKTYASASTASIPHCSQFRSPLEYDNRCIDSIGLFWKRVSCGLACADNDHWNAYPGRNNISTFPSPSAATSSQIIWPRFDDYGVTNFIPVISKDQINNAIPNPPATGSAGSCHPSNAGDYATGAGASKVVQVKYGDGTSRWFMAFSQQIHDTQTNQGNNANDKWRILWAYSADGFTWNVHPNILFRSTSETDTAFCGSGLLVMDLFVDGDYFYMTFTEVVTDKVYMVRSRIGSSTSVPGYTSGWSIAAYPLVQHPTNPNLKQYTWKPMTLGIRQDFGAGGLNAYSILPSTFPSDQVDFMVKEAAIARVFKSASANSPSIYIALTKDKARGQAEVMQVWSTTDLSVPFKYESQVNYSSAGIKPGQSGLELGFTHYVDNTPATPRITAPSFEFWNVESLANPNMASDQTSVLTVTRRTAKLTGGIFGP